MTDDRAARIAALRARRAGSDAANDTVAATESPTAPARTTPARRRHVAARSRAFALGAGFAGTAALVTSMWSGTAGAATQPGEAATALPAATMVVPDAASPQETVVIRIVRRPSPAAAAVRNEAASNVVAAAPQPATVAPQPAAPQPAPQPVTRSRRSG
jgi:hypothetical protein